MDTREKFSSAIADKNYERIRSFGNMFEFLDFCKEHRLTRDNSVTYWSEALQKMFIAY